MSPTIIKTGSLDIRVYPKDHAPPHVHVVGPGAEAKFRLSNCKCIRSQGFSKRSLARIEAFLKTHRAVLLEAWDDYQA